MARPLHLVFDLDRTLWDFDRNSTEVLTELFRSQLSLSEDEVRTLVERYQTINEKYWALFREGKVTKEGLRVARFVELLEPLMEDCHELAGELSHRYISKAPSMPHTIPGALDLLRELHVRYSIHILTNGSKETQHTKLKVTGMDKYVDRVWCLADGEERKPHPVVFERVEDELKASPHELVMVGDSLPVDCMPAYHRGWDAFWLSPSTLPSHQGVRRIRELNELMIHL